MSGDTNDMNSAEVSAKLDALTAMVATLAERAARQDELIAEMSPIVREVSRTAVSHFADLEDRGYFAFAKELARIGERVVFTYSTDDVAQLGENIVRILDTVKRVTQPDMLAIAQDATNALAASEEVEAKGVFGMLRETRDEDVRRGVAMMIEVLRYVGRGTARVASDGSAPQRDRTSDDAQAKLARLLGPSRATATPTPTPLRRAAATPTPAAPRSPAPRVPEQRARAASRGSGPMECTLIPEGEWSHERAAGAAASIGVTELSEDHWKVIEYARAEFLASGASPNIRKLATGSGVDTRTIYALWPTKPGIATAFVAGIPKPGGCL